jgi:hypothetical protein
VHVIVAKIIPAQRFVHVLRKLKGAQKATVQLDQKLEAAPHLRTQMWLDLLSMVNPEQLIEDSMPAPESIESVRGMLKHDMRPLISPAKGDLVFQAENDPASTFVTLLNDASITASGILSAGHLEPLDGWVSWLQQLPQLFQGHHPQCMADWHTRFWRSIMTQVGQNGAPSYELWWYVQSFTTQLLDWMMQIEGMVLDTSKQQLADRREQEKYAENQLQIGQSLRGNKRKRDEEPADNVPGPQQAEFPPLKKAALEAPGSLTLPSAQPTETVSPPIDDDATDADLDELRQGGPLDLPSFHTGLTSPVKGQAELHDDSAIDLGLEVDADAEKEARKFNKKDWFLSSDPADPAVGLGVLA